MKTKGMKNLNPQISIEGDIENKIVGDETVSVFRQSDGFAVVERKAVGVDFIRKFDAEGWLFP